jgi:peptidoglycan/xylan/chitin deacetylase (PgdA/CDA1 family)
LTLSTVSFDDGPTCAHGPLYQLLKQNNQQATLFYIGGNVASYPEEARLGFANGHEICVHTW